MTHEPTHDAAGHALPCSCNAGPDRFDPIDVDAYEAAGVARVEKAQEPDCCVHGCRCFREEHEEGADIGGYVWNTDDCEHCPNCCGCTPCMYAHHA